MKWTLNDKTKRRTKKNELYEINEIKVTRKIFSIIILNYMKI